MSWAAAAAFCWASSSFCTSNICRSRSATSADGGVTGSAVGVGEETSWDTSTWMFMGSFRLNSLLHATSASTSGGPRPPVSRGGQRPPLYAAAAVGERPQAPLFRHGLGQLPNVALVVVEVDRHAQPADAGGVAPRDQDAPLPQPAQEGGVAGRAVAERERDDARPR